MFCVLCKQSFLSPFAEALKHAETRLRGNFVVLTEGLNIMQLSFI